MKFALLNNTTGLVDTVAASDLYKDGQVYGNATAINIDSLQATDTEILTTYHMENGVWKTHIPQLTPYSTWNNISFSWEILPEQIQSIKEQTKQKIDLKRNELISAAITFQTNLFDANPTALQNINGKLQELQAKQDLQIPIDTNELFWRDANNTTHTWNDATSFKQWLQGLVIAISERTSQLYQISWQKKAEIDALQDVDSILNYDINANW